MTSLTSNPREARLAHVQAMEQHLADLGLGPTYTNVDGVRHRSTPEGLGWCFPLYAAEEAWPPGAECCLIVRWLPDAAFAYDHTAGRLPDGTEAHWSTRAAATMAALRSLGYQAAVTGPPRLPHLHAGQDILVWRVAEGASPAPWPPDSAWAEAAPAVPDYVRPAPEDLSPVDIVDEELSCAPIAGTAFALGALAVLWPPYARACVRVLWQPDLEYRRRPDDSLPHGATAHWAAGTDGVQRALEAAGYRVQRPARATSPERDNEAGFLAWLP
ncbi:hypothetical protein [Streptomyces anulatus]|uniref:hypothetical protein n=1 Tax=Streptomyces anulatus TaxID=1892 RepID=UPI0036CC1081